MKTATDLPELRRLRAVPFFRTTVCTIPLLAAIFVLLAFPTITTQAGPGDTVVHRKIADGAGFFPSGLLENEDNFGTDVAHLGDLNGDGYPELAVGARGDNTGGFDRGAVYVFSLNHRHQVIPASIVKIADGSGGLPADTLVNYEFFGNTTTAVPDMDSDGNPELAVGTGAGRIYVLFLNGTGQVKSFTRIADGEGGLPSGTLPGVSLLGSVGIASLGDFDGDGNPDIAVGDPNDDSGGTDQGAVFLFFLNSNGTVKSFQKIAQGVGGFTAILQSFDHFGTGVGNAGDINGDGVQDLAVGARGDNTGGLDRGAVYVLFLNANGTVKAHQKIADGVGGLPSNTLQNSDFFGTRAKGIGDLDGDGVPDITSSAEASPSRRFVLFLNRDGMVKNFVEIAGGKGGLPEFGLPGLTTALTPIGDITGDGIVDIAASARLDNTGGTNRGAIYLFPLHPDGTVKTNQIIGSDLGGFPDALLDSGDLFGKAIAPVGDVDGNGTIDLVVGARSDDDNGSGAGAVYLLYMNPDRTVLSHEKLTGGGGLHLFGDSVCPLGDLDGDGYHEFAVTAPWEGDGVIYIIYLRAPIAGFPVKDVKLIFNGFGGLPAGTFSGDLFEAQIANIGDIDGNGVPDLAAGGAQNRLHILFLNADATVKSNRVLEAGSGGLPSNIHHGTNTKFGQGAAGIGDLNLDGVPDIAVGAPYDDLTQTDGGAVYILFLNADGTVKSHKKHGEAVAELFGWSVAGLGDANKDGIPDIAVGGPAGDSVNGDNRGMVALMFLDRAGNVAETRLIGDDFGQGLAHGTLFDDEFFGNTVTMLGDLDNDGCPDLGVGTATNHFFLIPMDYGNALFQPDLRIGKKGNPATHKGNDYYTTSGARQKHNVSLRKTRNTKFHTSLENDGYVVDSIRLTATKPNRKVKWKVFRLTGGRKNITGALKVGGYTQWSMPPGFRVVMQYQVRAGVRTGRVRRTFRLVARSMVEHDQADVAKAMALRKK